MTPRLLLRVLRMAIKTLGQHKMRAGLTVLGIVFGVSSVIAMLSVGEGTSQEIQEKLQRLGNTNILIKSVKLPQEQFSGGQTKSGGGRRQAARYGVTYNDMESMSRYVPDLKSCTPIKTFTQNVRFRDRTMETGLVATVPWYPDVTKYAVIAGRFISQQDMITGEPVCVVGARLARILFAGYDPLGANVRIGEDLYRVVGVVGDIYGTQRFTNKPLWFIGENQNVYIPLKTWVRRNGDYYVKRQEGSSVFENVDIYELILTLNTQDSVLRAADIVHRLLADGHKREDYEVVVPLQLIREAQETRRLFNIVLGSIAAISLVVGGIGIMNIMLATVSERTREIGIRRALGARQRDIVLQFLVETLVLATIGGIIGMLVGAAIPKTITLLTHVRTVLTVFSFTIAFGVSVFVGLVFGIYPARRAAQMDPIEALRHE